MNYVIDSGMVRGLVLTARCDTLYLHMSLCSSASVTSELQCAPCVQCVLTLALVLQAFYWGTSEWTAQQITEAWEVAKRLDLIGPTMVRCLKSPGVLWPTLLSYMSADVQRVCFPIMTELKRATSSLRVHHDAPAGAASVQPLRAHEGGERLRAPGEQIINADALEAMTPCRTCEPATATTRCGLDPACSCCHRSIVGIHDAACG